MSNSSSLLLVDRATAFDDDFLDFPLLFVDFLGDSLLSSAAELALEAAPLDLELLLEVGLEPVLSPAAEDEPEEDSESLPEEDEEEEPDEEDPEEPEMR